MKKIEIGKANKTSWDVVKYPIFINNVERGELSVHSVHRNNGQYKGKYIERSFSAYLDRTISNQIDIPTTKLEVLDWGFGNLNSVNRGVVGAKKVVKARLEKLINSLGKTLDNA